MPQPFTHRPRSFPDETLASYSRRVLELNLEPPDEPERVAAAAGHPLESVEGLSSWVAHLRARTGRDVPTGPDPARTPRHADGATCPGCGDLLTVRAMCRDCADDQTVSLYPTFETPVCHVHARWAGFTDHHDEQVKFGAAHLAASVLFEQLAGEHRLDARLYTVLVAAFQAEDPKRSEADVFPELVAIAATITDAGRQAEWIGIELRFADAFSALQGQITEAVGAHHSGVARAIWLYARSEIARWRHAILRRSPPEAPAPHAFKVLVPLPETIPGPGAIDAFEHYFDASSDTLATAAEFNRTRFRTSRPAPPLREVQLTCPRGHAFIGRRKQTSRTDGRMPEAFDGRCSRCDAFEVTPGDNDLATVAPELAAQLDIDANDGLQPSQIAAKSSARKVWWRCERGHPYAATPANRVLEHMGCPVCLNREIVTGINDLATLYPELLLEWAADADLDLDPTRIGAATDRRVDWICKNGHPFNENIRRRVEGRDCPVCEEVKLKAAKASLEYTHPEIAAEFDHEWNAQYGTRLASLTHGSMRNVRWICGRCGRPFHARVEQRTRQGNGCPTCVNRNVAVGLNDLATRNPTLVLEWDREQNRIGPDETAAVTKRYYWTCLERGHTTHVSFETRERTGGCGLCLPRERRIMYRTGD